MLILRLYTLWYDLAAEISLDMMYGSVPWQLRAEGLSGLCVTNIVELITVHGSLLLCSRHTGTRSSWTDPVVQGWASWLLIKRTRTWNISRHLSLSTCCCVNSLWHQPVIYRHRPKCFSTDYRELVKNGLNRMYPNKVEDSEHLIMIWYQETLGIIDLI